MENASTVTITQKRYESLQDTETRVHVLVDMLMNEIYVDKEKILLYLGFEVEHQKLRDKKAEQERKEQIRNANINKRD